MPSATYILCRSTQRRERELVISARLEERIEEGMAAIARECEQRGLGPAVGQKAGHLLAQHTYAASLFEYGVISTACTHARLEWRNAHRFRDRVRQRVASHPPDTRRW